MPPAVPLAERLWEGGVGEAYHRAHRQLSRERAAFWYGLAQWLRPKRVLEVGAGRGLNLIPFASVAPTRVGMDINRWALKLLHETGNGRAAVARAQALPFTERAFDLVFTVGTLIHIDEADLPLVFDELARVAARDVLLLEYDDGTSTERDIPWRGQRGVCHARPYGLRYWRQQPGFTLLGRRDLGPAEGFERVTMAHLRRRP